MVGDLITEDVEAAKALLAEAGYPDGEGMPTLTLITQNSQDKKDTAQVMQAMWKQNLGVNVEIVTYESKVYWDEQKAGNFDICYDGWTGDYPDPSTNLECFLASRNETQCRWSGELADQYNALLMEKPFSRGRKRARRKLCRGREDPHGRDADYSSVLPQRAAADQYKSDWSHQELYRTYSV